MAEVIGNFQIEITKKLFFLSMKRIHQLENVLLSWQHKLNTMSFL
jgi:hypothetical protein